MKRVVQSTVLNKTPSPPIQTLIMPAGFRAINLLTEYRSLTNRQSPRKGILPQTINPVGILSLVVPAVLVVSSRHRRTFNSPESFTAPTVPRPMGSLATTLPLMSGPTSVMLTQKSVRSLVHRVDPVRSNLTTTLLNMLPQRALKNFERPLPTFIT